VALEEARRGEPDEHDGRAQDDVEDEVVGRRDHRERHRGGHADREQADDEPGREPEHHDPDEQVPAEVEAREGRVLVRERRRLEPAVGGRPLDDRVDEARSEQPGRRHGKQREEQEPDRGREEDRVPEQVVGVAALAVEQDRDGGDHGPVAEDVDPVRQRDERGVRKHGRLNRLLPVEREVPLEVQNRPAVVDRVGGASLRGGPHAAVRQGSRPDQHELAGRPVRDQPNPTCHSVHETRVAPSPPGGIGASTPPRR
jgi:hypothetical protein